MDNGTNKNNQLIKRGKIFRGVMYFNMVVIVLLFVILGIGWVSDRNYYSHGGGDVMALLYVGPIVILNMLALLYFIVISLLTIRRGQVALIQYKKCAAIYGAQLLLSIIAIIIIFI